MRSKIFKEILDEMNSDHWYIKLRRWLRIKLWLFGKLHFGQQRDNLNEGILLIQDSPGAIKEFSSLLMAYRVFKSSGGSIEQAQRQLGTFHSVDKSTYIPVATLTAQEFTLEEPCMKMYGTIKVFCCATTCAGLKNCKLKP